MKINFVKKIVLAAAVGSLVAFNAGAIISYNEAALNTPTTTPGNQAGSPFNLGEVFTVNSAFTVGYLGAFDASQDGWGNETITVAIYNITGQPNGLNILGIPSIVGSAVAFSAANPGTLGADSSYRFQAVTPFTLDAGSTYMVVASGLGSSVNPDYNSQGGTTLITANTYGGALTWVPSGNYYDNYSGSPSFPTIWDFWNGGGPTARYGAGSFAPVPEAGIFAVAGVGLLGLIYVGRGLILRRRLALA